MNGEQVKANHRTFALAATASLALLGASAGTASAQFVTLGDAAVARDAPMFRLNPFTLEPGCFKPGMGRLHHGVDVDSRIDVTQKGSEAQITLMSGTNFSIDQVLVGGENSGYAIANSFDTGSGSGDPDIDPGQTATDLSGPKGDDVDEHSIIVCVSDHPDGDQNEPYVADGAEVAAINRPILQPTIAALGVSAVGNLNTYKVGFGYEVQRGYDSTWRNAFRNDGVIGPGMSFGDPQAFDADRDGRLDHVIVKSRPDQSGVRRYNDMDEFGEAFNEADKASYGQPISFDVSGSGDPFAYLHKSLPGTIDGGFAPFDSWLEGEADQTSAQALMTFTAEGDLPLSWSVKPSLAPTKYGRQVALTDAMLRAWDQSWQDYYAGKGAKPTLPLAPGTNSPKPDPSIEVLVNLPVQQPVTGPATTTTNTTVIHQTTPAPAPYVGAASKPVVKKAKIRSTRIMKTASGRRVVKIFVDSAQSSARVRISLYTARGGKVTETSKTVATNRSVQVSGLHVAKTVKTVKAKVL
jgi:hypothetical protein